MKTNSGKRKFVWKIVFTKGNIVRFCFFCFFGVQIILFFLWSILAHAGCFGGWHKTMAFLNFFPLLLLIIDFFIMRKILIKSQPKD